jgi:site-specific recombinase XerD
MGYERPFPLVNKLHEQEPWGRSSGCLANGLQVQLATDRDWYQPSWISATAIERISEAERPLQSPSTEKEPQQETIQPDSCSISVAEFIERNFIPEYVASRRSAGRSHFRSILNHVLPPEQVARGFALDAGKSTNKLKSIPDWPYIDSTPLCEVNAQMVQRLTSAALQSGYSTQTVAHIRNVIRSIFSHAIRTGYYFGTNPANLAAIPAITRKAAHSLSVEQLKDVMEQMRYPEREIALFSMLTDMNVAEICGLQWKYVNVSNESRWVDQEVIPPRTIGIRTQSYRGAFEDVSASRRRFARSLELLCSILRNLKTRKHFTGPDDFVLASRRGTPIHPENVAARRLKHIGASLDMPWLAWRVFHRTHANLRSEGSRKLYEELERILTPHKRPFRT